MKLVIKYSLIVVLSLVVIDIIFGMTMKCYVKNCHIPGDYRTIDYLFKYCDDDIVVLGNSLALNSVDPVVIEDSIGMTCWNGACNGQSLPYFETVLDAMVKQHVPKYILLGMRPGTSGDINRRFRMLAPYYNMGYDVLDEYMNSGPRYQKLLMLSSLYRYNTIWFRIMLYYIVEPGEKGERGFIAKPIPPRFPKLRKGEDKNLSGESEAILQRMMDMCKKNEITMVMFFPPILIEYENCANSYVENCINLCEKNGVEVYNAFQDSKFLSHPEWFYDNHHLNKDGSAVFSRQFASWLRNWKQSN